MGSRINKLIYFACFLHAYLNKGAVLANAFSLILFPRMYKSGPR